LLNSGSLSPGHSYSYAFYQPGLYTYQCSYHFTIPAMSDAWVNVTGPPVTPPASQNPPDYTLITVAAITVAAVIVATLALFVKKKNQRRIREELRKTPWIGNLCTFDVGPYCQ